MEAYLGQIILFAGRYAPEGWAYCDGSSVVISANQALFAVIGTTYGGDGVNTFKLPDLRSRLPLGAGQGTGLQKYNLGANGGAESVAVTLAQSPSHSHSFNASAAAAAVPTASGNVLGQVPANHVVYLTPPAGVTLTPTALGTKTISATGNGQAHANLMPTATIAYLICTSGLFPMAN